MYNKLYNVHKLFRKFHEIQLMLILVKPRGQREEKPNPKVKKLGNMDPICNPTPRIPNSSSCCTSQKASHPVILETESGIIDPLVSKRPEN